ncbi:MAG: glucosyltransferase domain-containing protein [Chloroflexi bacterium]|nr:glucosyltransferase domain-containing protein [Chloroflexota bacterium]
MTMQVRKYKKTLDALTVAVDAFLLNLQAYLSENVVLIFALAAVALAAYGFELFNFNITIDEEAHATYSVPTLDWIRQGRWGMYLLTRYLIPYTIIPFVPLFVALLFHLAAILLLLRSWRVQSRLEQLAVGTVAMAFPLMAYIYSFSTINFGVGIGLFCIALSVYIFDRASGMRRLLAFVPATFAIAIYQVFIPALVGAYLVYILSVELRAKKAVPVNLIMIAGVHVLAVIVYYLLHQFAILVAFPASPYYTYIADQFNISYLIAHFSEVTDRVFISTMMPVYFGGEKAYSLENGAIGALMVVSLAGLFINILRTTAISYGRKVFLIALSLGLLILPFGIGLLTQGLILYRSLVALPVVISGVVMLGMLNSPGIFRKLVALLTVYCVFQFVMSANHLSAASHLSLQADRSLATTLIGRIEEAQTQAGGRDLRYMEIVGYYDRPSTNLIPEMETLGMSYFEIAEGNVNRILLFLQTLGYSGLEPLPLARQAQLVDLAESMPVWPDGGSVRVVDDVVLVKFGHYSATQKRIICGDDGNRDLLRSRGFCP